LPEYLCSLCDLPHRPLAALVEETHELRRHPRGPARRVVPVRLPVLQAVRVRHRRQTHRHPAVPDAERPAQRHAPGAPVGTRGPRGCRGGCAERVRWLRHGVSGRFQGSDTRVRNGEAGNPHQCCVGSRYMICRTASQRPDPLGGLAGSPSLRGPRVCARAKDRQSAASSDFATPAVRASRADADYAPARRARSCENACR
jgi:hypothetical protein